jgi:flagellar assembly protein FliH
MSSSIEDAAMNSPRKFGFDTVFDGEGEILASAPPRKTYYSAAEVEQIRADAFAEGQRVALDRAREEEIRQLGQIRQAIGQAMTVLAHVAQGHRAGAAELALTAARKIADAALERFPEAPAQAALDALLVEVQGHPRLFVRAPEALVERMQEALDRAAQAAGFLGQVVVKDDPRLNGAAFVFEWGEGRAAFDPEQAAARITAALQAALAADGLHAEPFNP